MIIVKRQTELLQIILTLRPASRLAGLLDRGQQQRDQDRNDRNYDQQLNQREPTRAFFHHLAPKNKQKHREKENSVHSLDSSPPPVKIPLGFF
jgi:hypothetical protein